MEDIKAGSVVRLKHNSPLMTVEATHTHANGVVVRCVWFDSDSHLHRDQFPLAALVEVTQPGPHIGI
jgi:uncharacterized protein YodC (DUF2158 family)